MRIDKDGLRISITDYANARTAGEIIQFFFKSRPEIVSFQAVDRARKAFFLVKRCQTCTLRAEM